MHVLILVYLLLFISGLYKLNAKTLQNWSKLQPIQQKTAVSSYKKGIK